MILCFLFGAEGPKSWLEGHSAGRYMLGVGRGLLKSPEPNPWTFPGFPYRRGAFFGNKFGFSTDLAR